MTPNTDEAFLREVDEELRRDQMVGVWQNYGRWIIVAIIAGLAIFGGVLGWRAWSHSQSESDAIKLQTAYDSIGSGNTKGATAAIDELAANAKPGYSALARMLQANRLLSSGDTKGAVAKFADIAADTSVGQPIRDLALVRQTATEFDTLAPQQVIDRLRPLATKDSAWLGSAGEMTAMAYLRLNKPAEARALFKMIAENDKVPESFRQRAVQAVDAVDVGANDQKGK